MTTNRVLAFAALALGAFAVVAGQPRRPTPGRIDVAQLAHLIDTEADHVTAVELAGWLRDRKANLRVVDVRPAADFDAYHIPSAENVPLGSLAQAHFATTDTLVLYSDGGAHAAQAWVLLRSLGFTEVYFLRGGLSEWLDDVMDPAIAPDASPAEREAFAKTSEVSRFFGGTPHVGVRRASEAAADRIAAMKRRGC